MPTRRILKPEFTAIFNQPYELFKGTLTEEVEYEYTWNERLTIFIGRFTRAIFLIPFALLSGVVSGIKDAWNTAFFRD